MNASSIFLIFVLDFMIGVPVSLLLPTIGFNTRYKRSRNFREKSPEITKRIGKKDPLTSRLTFLFDVLQVHDANCQQKIICETLKDQQKFSPLSDLLLAIFRFDFLQTFKIFLIKIFLCRKPKRTLFDGGKRNSYGWDLYYYAYHVGHNAEDFGVCTKTFGSCSHDSTEFLNVPVIHLWQLASKYLSLRLDDT